MEENKIVEKNETNNSVLQLTKKMRKLTLIVWIAFGAQMVMLIAIFVQIFWVKKNLADGILGLYAALVEVLKVLAHG